MPEIKVLPDPPAVAREAADRIVTLAEAAIELHDKFTIALAGGSTPEALFKLLASEQYQSAIDWPKVQIYSGDERCVPPDDQGKQLSHGSRDAALEGDHSLATMSTAFTAKWNPQEAARQYGEMLKEQFGDWGESRTLDLILLGMGDDGHTASLFPHTSRAAREQAPLRSQLCRAEKNLADHDDIPVHQRRRSRHDLRNRRGQGGSDRRGAGRTARCRADCRSSESLRLSGHLTWLIDAAAAGMDDRIVHRCDAFTLAAADANSYLRPEAGTVPRYWCCHSRPQVHQRGVPVPWLKLECSRASVIQLKAALMVLC